MAETHHRMLGMVGNCDSVLSPVASTGEFHNQKFDKEGDLKHILLILTLTVKKEISFVDGLVSVVSFGFYQPETITVRGEIASE